MKKTATYLTLVYGLALIVLGFWGHYKGSNASLYSGVGSGVLLLLSSVFMFQNKERGTYAAVAILFFLGITFLVRYAMTDKTLPGALAALSATLILFLLLSLGNWNKKSH